MALDLAVVMQDVAARHEGLVVKMLRTCVHFTADPAHAVLASLDFVELARARDLPPAHVGVEAGPMTYTDGDYYGLTVIIAARIASALRLPRCSSAAPGQLPAPTMSCSTTSGRARSRA